MIIYQKHMKIFKTQNNYMFTKTIQKCLGLSVKHQIESQKFISHFFPFFLSITIASTIELKNRMHKVPWTVWTQKFMSQLNALSVSTNYYRKKETIFIISIHPRETGTRQYKKKNKKLSFRRFTRSFSV